jgi:xylulose-5-phosphate/fructose-6-phosphate phosphoketolase
MAIEVIDQANPPPLLSQLPVECLILARVSTAMHTEIAELMRIAAMIFLKDNVLVERDLRAEDIKPRLLGTPK